MNTLADSVFLLGLELLTIGLTGANPFVCVFWMGFFSARLIKGKQ